MKSGKWKYKVGGRARGIIPSLFLAVLFGGVSIYLYLDKQGIFLFSLLLTVFALVLVFVCVFQAKFVKVLNESEGVHYLIKCVRENGAGICRPDTDEGRKEYIIDGKTYGKTSIVICLVLLVLMLAITVPLRPCAAGSGLGGIICLSGIGAVLIILAAVIIRYLCFKVRIGSSGFYFRSGPFNGRYYQYCDIAGCTIEKQVYNHRTRPYGGTGTQLYYYYFIFTDKSGRTRKFQFQKSIHGHEAETLKMRIDQASGTSRKRRRAGKAVY